MLEVTNSNYNNYKFHYNVLYCMPWRIIINYYESTSDSQFQSNSKITNYRKTDNPYGQFLVQFCIIFCKILKK